MSKNPRFWRNVTLIALAHVVLIAGLIRWSLAARSAPDTESLVWLSTGDLEPGRSDNSVASSSKISIPSVESEPLKPNEEEKEQPALTQAKSEIELPKPTPMETPVPKAMAKPKATSKSLPKPIPKSPPKKTVLAKATKSSAHPKSSPPKPTGDQTDASNEKKSAKTKSSADNGAGKTSSASKASSHSGGGTSASEFGWYGNMLHDRFYNAWIQPTTSVPSGSKISTLVKVRIEKDGRVSKFDIIKPSENVVVNESVAAIAKRVTEVDSPPVGLGNGNHYDVKINFELNTDQETAR
jgi:outer membrane biosynthesis protein TonB